MSNLPNKKHNNSLHQVYLRYSWGAEINKELANEAARFIHHLEHDGLGYEVEKTIEQGKQAYRLVLDTKKQFDTNGEYSVRKWISQVSEQYPDLIINSLKIELDKILKHQQQSAQRKKHFTNSSNIRPVNFSDYHPLSLPYMLPYADWSIYIDESGQYFSHLSDEHGHSSPELGRVVALAVPGRTRLKGFSKPFHATESTPAEVDDCIQYILEQDVGVFGFTVNDPEAFAANWYSHIVLLIRWVLMQLPIVSGEPARAAFYIERNDAKLASRSIDSLASQLEGELQAINPSRFSGLQITTQLMDKNHPMNGYVDALAYTWGSPAAHSRDRLKKSSLLGHCLLTPDQQSMHRLYLAASRNEGLASAEWYQLCTAAANEPRQGFLGDQLKHLGLKTAGDFRLWQRYLDEIRERFRSKNYSLTQISHALDWLEKHKPLGHELPDIYRLPLETARLGQENHQGKVNLERLKTCLQLINRLEEEDAQQACGALLRVAVSGSNSFEFKLLQPVVQQWLDKPVAVSGLASYARLHSTLGQMHAFCHEHEQAIEHFEQAIDLLAKLSDPQRAKREISQTEAYRRIALMDSMTTLSADFLELLAEDTDTNAYSRAIAVSSQNMRYEHHLWLRTLISFPDETANAGKTYIMQSHLWTSGMDHPWGLIAAYRGWLLHNAERAAEAIKQFNHAIELCDQPSNGPVLWWMAEVLRTLASAIGITTQQLPSQEERDRLHIILPAAPHEHLQAFAQAGPCSSTNALTWLKRCLPFNFH